MNLDFEQSLSIVVEFRASSETRRSRVSPEHFSTAHDHERGQNRATFLPLMSLMEVVI